MNQSTLLEIEEVFEYAIGLEEKIEGDFDLEDLRKLVKENPKNDPSRDPFFRS